MSSDETQDAFASQGARFDPTAVTVIGPYKGLRYFAAGGMAWLYEARHPQFPEKRLAVKLMKSEFAVMPQMRERFLREAQLLARVGHPHLVSVHSFGVDEASRSPYFAMDYIDGGTLAERLDAEGALPLHATGELFDRVLGALAALHLEGVIHRDIKPSNILLWRSGEPMLADLGIARDTQALGSSTTQHFIGSPKYSSPEQAHGLRLDPRTDVFSLGLSLFETLVGYHPYEDAKNVDTSSAASLIGLLALLYRDKKPIPLEFPREIPKAVRAVVRTAVEIEPDKRFSDANEMRRALRSAMRSAEESEGGGALTRGAGALFGWLGGNAARLGIGLGATAALAGLVWVGHTGWSAYQRDRARAELARVRQVVTAFAPEDAAVAGQLAAAAGEIDRDDPESALAHATALCVQLAPRAGTSVDAALADTGAALQGAEFTVRHAALGGDAWQELDQLAKDESRRAPPAAGAPACDAPLRLADYSLALRDANGALAAALAGAELRGKVGALREQSHAPELASRVDDKALADADAAFAANDLPRAFELYMHAALTARAADLAQRFAPQLREIAAAPEFAERRNDVSGALTRIVKLGTLRDFEALAAELEPTEAAAAAALVAVRGDVEGALAAAEQALAKARESGVAKDTVARGETALASARADAGKDRFTAAMASAVSLKDELAHQTAVVTEGAGAARGAREAALATRAAALALGAPERALAKGDALVEKADKLVAAGDPVKGVDALTGADKEFEAARSAAAAAATRAAEKVRAEAAAAKQKAGELGASAEDLAEGEQAEQRAEQALAATPVEAGQQFSAARDAFQRAPLRVAGERASQARAAAVAAGAAADALAVGDAALEQARAATAPADGLRLSGEAERAFAAAGADAGKANALAARQVALGAQGKAVRAQAVESDLRAGRAAIQDGDAALKKGDFAAAAERFTAARGMFEEAEKAALARGPAAP